MNYSLYISLILLICKKIIASKLTSIPDGHFVKKGVGILDNIIEEYHTCIPEKTDFIFYEIDLYTNEYLEISCGKDLDLEPLKDNKFFDKSGYINKLGGPYERIDFNDTKSFKTFIYDIETKYNHIEKYWRIYNKGYKDKGEIKSIYLHCYNSNKIINSTIQINLIGDWKLLKKENEFIFDNYKFSSYGKNLTYIKSMRLGTLTKTKCKDSKLTIKYNKLIPTLKKGYSPYKLLSSSKIQFIDIAKEALEIKDGINTIDLRESNRTLLDLERCQTILTCDKHKDRKLIYVYPKYDELPGLNPKSKDADELTVQVKKGSLYSFSIDTLNDKIISFHIPKGNQIFPKTCPKELSYWRDGQPEYILNNIKITEIYEDISIIDTSSVFARIPSSPYCSVSSGVAEDDEIAMIINVNPTCNISNKNETISDYHCVLYGIIDGYVVIKSSEKDKSKLKFIEKIYTRDYSKGEGTNDIWYKESNHKIKPKIINKGGTEVHIKIDPKIYENPIYFISSDKHESSIKNPKSVVEIYLSDDSIIKEPNGIVNVYRQVHWTSLFYSITLQDQPLRINCSNFLHFNDKRPNTPILYPREDNKVFLDISDGKTDPKKLKPVSITDHFGVNGFNFITSSKYDDLEVVVKGNPIIYSDHMKPFYYICAYNTEGIETRGAVDPYAIIQVIPLNKNIGNEQCGMKNPTKNKEGKNIPCNVSINNNNDKFGYFCPTYLDIPKVEKYLPKSVVPQLPLNNQIECKYGNNEINTLVGKDEFFDLIYPEGKDSSGTSLIYFSLETPIFKKNKGNIIKCTCKGSDPITVKINSTLPVEASEDGFIVISLGFSIISIIIGSIFSI